MSSSTKARYRRHNKLTMEDQQQCFQWGSRKARVAKACASASLVIGVWHAKLRDLFVLAQNFCAKSLRLNLTKDRITT